mgnify:CR=1 FL=1
MSPIWNNQTSLSPLLKERGDFDEPSIQNTYKDSQLNFSIETKLAT